MALVVAIGGHLGLWMLLLRPVGAWRETVADDANADSVLKLRFIREPHPSSWRSYLQGAPSSAHIEPTRTKSLARLAGPQVVRHVGKGGDPRDEGALAGPTVIRMPDLHTMDNASGGDRGFLERLRAAQRADAVRGVPGSDVTYAPGIHLIDPMNQGIGAVMRKLQRAFGVTSSHCIDVDVWRTLTPEQLSARHISPNDVDRIDAKYQCNDPPGLHF